MAAQDIVKQAETEQGVQIPTTPAVVRYLIDKSGWEVGELAQNLGVTAGQVEDWMTTSKTIGLDHLQKLGKLTFRPYIWYTKDAPPDEADPTDYRDLPRPRLSRHSVGPIMHAIYYQWLAEDMMSYQKIDQRPRVGANYTLQDSPEAAAEQERENLGFGSRGMPSPEKAPETFYDWLVDKVESQNVFVFQGMMPAQELRVYSVTDSLPYHILVNLNDSFQERAFALLHGYGHILLEKSGKCTPETTPDGADGLQAVEAWCNSFAAFVMVPREEFSVKCNQLLESGKDSGQIAQTLSERFDPCMVGTLFQATNLARCATASGECGQIMAEHKNARPKPADGFPIAGYIDKCVIRMGKKLIKLVLEAEEKGLIHESNVMRYLDIAHGDMNEVGKRVYD